MLDARQVNTAMSALIDGTFGCLDAAAETINARLGSSVSKGTLLKILSGQHQWPAIYIWALEDAAGRYSVSRLRGCGAPSEAARAGLRVLDAASVASRRARRSLPRSMPPSPGMPAGRPAPCRKHARRRRPWHCSSSRSRRSTTPTRVRYDVRPLHTHGVGGGTGRTPSSCPVSRCEVGVRFWPIAHLWNKRFAVNGW
jgi:hypothetical protein